MATLGEVFRSFCAFGDKDAAAKASPMMDGSKLAKMTRDLKLLDKHLTSTDIDIMFSKVKAKTERKINFKQFQEVLKLMAAKKYPGEEADAAYAKMKEIVMAGKGPAATGATKAVKSGAVDRLTDTTKYTGSHKERFQEDGKGKGIEGRKDLPDSSGYVTGFKGKE